MVNRNLKELMHYGVMGMHWGVRRYQPYGEGGYDPKHKGKFVGKEARKQQKATYEYLKDRYANYKGHNSDVVKAFRGTDRYKQQAKAIKKANKALERAVTYEEKADRYGRRQFRKDKNQPFDQKQYDEYVKKWEEAEDEYDRLIKEGKEAMSADAKKYIKDVLGKYRKKKVKEIRNDAAVEVGLERVNIQRLSDLLYSHLTRQYEYVDLSELD